MPVGRLLMMKGCQHGELDKNEGVTQAKLFCKCFRHTKRLCGVRAFGGWRSRTKTTFPPLDGAVQPAQSRLPANGKSSCSAIAHRFFLVSSHNVKEYGCGEQNSLMVGENKWNGHICHCCSFWGCCSAACPSVNLLNAQPSRGLHGKKQPPRALFSSPFFVGRTWWNNKDELR